LLFRSWGPGPGVVGSNDRFRHQQFSWRWSNIYAGFLQGVWAVGFQTGVYLCGSDVWGCQTEQAQWALGGAQNNLVVRARIDCSAHLPVPIELVRFGILTWWT
jgi:hypothetical protein